MGGNRKDNKGRRLETGERYDSKNNRYVFQKMIDGERVSITAQTLSELRRKKNEALFRIDKGGKLNSSKVKMTLNAYFDYWMDTFAKSGRKATTCTNYKSYYCTYIKETIGKKVITKITKADCQKIINEMIESGKKHSTMANLKSCLNVVFECAIDDDVIVKNPAKNLQIPQTESKKRTAIEERHIKMFMDYVRNSEQYSYSYPAFVILFNLGVRVGEMAALTWSDVDFKNGTININKTVNRYRKADYGFTVGVASTKSKTSVRSIPMNSVVRNTLLKLKMKNTPSLAKLPYVDDSGHVRGEIDGFLFTNAVSNPWNEPSFLNLINRITKKYNEEAKERGLEQIGEFCPHMARHTYTSLAYSAGADVKIVSQILGHASTAVTMDTYTHLTEDKKRQQEEVVQTIKIS